MYRNIFAIVIVVLTGFIFAGLFLGYNSDSGLNPVASHYVANGAEEVGAANLVTAVVVTYRGLDTLGEVTILFLTAAIIGFFLKTTKTAGSQYKVRRTSEILYTASKILIPVIILFGAYIFINGHLTPGGGFQGGAVIASAIVLMLLSRPEKKFSHKVITVVESISGFSYVVIGILGLILAGGFLDNKILSLGEFGTLFSAGAIPLIYIFVGLKVGAELSGILINMQETQKEN